MAQEEALNEIADGRLRNVMAQNKSSTCTDVRIGAAVLFNKTRNKRSAPRWSALMRGEESGGPEC